MLLAFDWSGARKRLPIAILLRGDEVIRTALLRLLTAVFCHLRDITNSRSGARRMSLLFALDFQKRSAAPSSKINLKGALLVSLLRG
jgi:hypothetical protein